MPTFFVEFEFKTPLQTVYWLPLALVADSLAAARDIAQRLQQGICEHYTLTSIIGPSAAFTSERLRRYQEQGAKGRPAVLNITLWKIKDIPSSPELSFDEHIHLKLCDPNLKENTLAVGEQHHVPVHQIFGDPLNFEEFLLIHVVLPAERSKSTT